MTAMVREFRHHPLLGTLVEVRVHGSDAATAERIDRVVVAEMSRLEQVLSIFDPSSELARWKRGEVAEPSEELRTVLGLALDWQRRSDGAFNTSAGVLTALWRAAEASGCPPSRSARRAAAARIREPAYEVLADGRVRAVADLSGIDLNAFAKGWIVDRAIDAAWAVGACGGLVVSAGGDLRHRGDQPIPVGIENPLRPFDNEPPIATIALANAALASSGRARRGFRVGDRWYAHVLDPRTGDTVDGVASISVVADDAATADVIATIAGVLPPAEAVVTADALGTACLVVSPEGERLANERWTALDHPPP